MADRRTKAELLAEIELLEQQRKEWQSAAFQENEKKHEAWKELKDQKQTILKLQQEIKDLEASRLHVVEATKQSLP